MVTDHTPSRTSAREQTGLLRQESDMVLRRVQRGSNAWPGPQRSVTSQRAANGDWGWEQQLVDRRPGSQFQPWSQDLPGLREAWVGLQQWGHISQGLWGFGVYTARLMPGRGLSFSICEMQMVTFIYSRDRSLSNVHSGLWALREAMFGIPPSREHMSSTQSYAWSHPIT